MQQLPNSVTNRKVICPVCEKKGMKSRVRPSGGWKTDMYPNTYWDEDGNLHVHDLNIITEEFVCEHGHRWRIECAAPGASYL